MDTSRRLNALDRLSLKLTENPHYRKMFFENIEFAKKELSGSNLTNPEKTYFELKKNYEKLCHYSNLVPSTFEENWEMRTYDKNKTKFSIDNKKVKQRLMASSISVGLVAAGLTYLTLKRLTK
jgi:hypothetical protein